MPGGHDEITKQFDIFDQQGDGKIDGLQIGSLVRSAGLKPTNENLKKALGKEYAKGDRVVVDDVKKVYDALEKNSKESGSVNDYIEVLKVFDKDGAGKIPGGELRGTLCSLGERLEPWEVDLVTKGMEDADGNIKIQEFCKRITTEPPKLGQS